MLRRQATDEEETGVVAYRSPVGYVRRTGPDFPEPICPVCLEPIRWCLDMFSFTDGGSEVPFTLAHARCVWTDEAFRKQAALAPTTEQVDAAFNEGRLVAGYERLAKEYEKRPGTKDRSGGLSGDKYPM